jgi:ferredoxin--NADP+ reductase
LQGLYASGWIKRGPSGVIGTNKPDALETVECMLEDLQADRFLSDDDPASGKSRDAVEQYLRRRDVPYIGYPDWLKLDAIEIENGKSLGRPRVKFTRREDFLAALERAGTT